MLYLTHEINLDEATEAIAQYMAQELDGKLIGWHGVPCLIVEWPYEHRVTIEMIGREAVDADIDDLDMLHPDKWGRVTCPECFGFGSFHETVWQRGIHEVDCPTCAGRGRVHTEDLADWSGGK